MSRIRKEQLGDPLVFILFLLLSGFKHVKPTELQSSQVRNSVALDFISIFTPHGFYRKNIIEQIS